MDEINEIIKITNCNGCVNLVEKDKGSYCSYMDKYFKDMQLLENVYCKHKEVKYYDKN